MDILKNKKVGRWRARRWEGEEQEGGKVGR